MEKRLSYSHKIGKNESNSFIASKYDWPELSSTIRAILPSFNSEKKLSLV